MCKYCIALNDIQVDCIVCGSRYYFIKVTDQLKDCVKFGCRCCRSGYFFIRNFRDIQNRDIVAYAFVFNRENGKFIFAGNKEKIYSDWLVTSWQEENISYIRRNIGEFNYLIKTNYIPIKTSLKDINHNYNRLLSMTNYY